MYIEMTAISNHDDFLSEIMVYEKHSVKHVF